MFSIVFEGICGFAFGQLGPTGKETRVFMPHQMPPMAGGDHNHDGPDNENGKHDHDHGHGCPDHISTLVAPTRYLLWEAPNCIPPDVLTVAPGGPTLGVWYLGADLKKVTNWSATAATDAGANAAAPTPDEMDGVIDLRQYFPGCAASAGRLVGKDSVVSLHGGKLFVNRISAKKIQLVEVGNPAAKPKAVGFFADQIGWSDDSPAGLQFHLSDGRSIQFLPGVSAAVSNQAAQFDGLGNGHFLAHYMSFDRNGLPMIDTQSYPPKGNHRELMPDAMPDPLQGNCGDPGIIP